MYTDHAISQKRNQWYTGPNQWFTISDFRPCPDMKKKHLKSGKIIPNPDALLIVSNVYTMYESEYESVIQWF